MVIFSANLQRKDNFRTSAMEVPELIENICSNNTVGYSHLNIHFGELKSRDNWQDCRKWVLLSKEDLSAKLGEIDDNIHLPSELNFKEESIPNWSKRHPYTP
ncbi:hypothetical protein CEXT_638841 [Caerostris extrusa]|uniref:Uncharacterized protein n=1 Tax=Caerostris extrusa TaxID=172846 RepID=A0AAV4XA63_CAEEX|nr:hypothetical protein CEXT_638841 [Caerostris extrusa]